MGYFFFFVYLFFCGWLLTKMRFVRQSGLSNNRLLLLFGAKVAAGVVAGRVYQSQPESDTWKNHTQALEEYQLLFNSPKIYFSNLFYSGYGHGYSGFWQASDSYWNDLKTNLLLKFISVLDIFSFGNYYINVILFNTLVFCGVVLLYRMFCNLYPNAGWPAIVACFLLPSTLFFTSMIHKDGFVFMALSVLCYCTHTWLQSGAAGIGKKIAVLLALAVMVVFRPYIVVALLPALLCWVVAVKYRHRPVPVFLIGFGLCAALFFSSTYIKGMPGLPAAVVEKQKAFLALEKANSYIGVPEVSATVSSFITAAPVALGHTLLRPFFTDYQLSVLLLPFAVEWWVYLILLLAFVFFHKKQSGLQHSYLVFAVAFTVTVLLIIGYTVPVLWAIIRYKTVLLPFMLAPVLLGIDWNKLLKLLMIKK
ncbi:MAG TPA: hypothetical protein PKC39_10570 [Ferruginibacter sp.]|nr:hypothetical protein [Ferruginibacter sp.]HMP21392.1 hypothetical protein [Ferruginibacter sp.]